MGTLIYIDTNIYLNFLINGDTAARQKMHLACSIEYKVRI